MKANILTTIVIKFIFGRRFTHLDKKNEIYREYSSSHKNRFELIINHVNHYTMKVFLLLVIMTIFLTSCDTHEHLTGNYYLGYADSEEQTSVRQKCYSGYTGNIGGGIFYVEWNDDFIIAKQHPTLSDIDFILGNIRRNKDTLNSFNQSSLIFQNNSEQVIDSLTKLVIRNTKIKSVFDYTLIKSITFYYLIDLKNKIKVKNRNNNDIIVDVTYFCYNLNGLIKLKCKLNVPAILPNYKYLYRLD